MPLIDSAIDTRLNPASLALVFAGLYLLRLIYNRLRPGLRDIPGPTLAKYTRLWKAYSVWKGNHHLAEIDLHKKHGPLVRIGPKHISFCDPAAIPDIYGLNKGFTKVGFDKLWYGNPYGKADCMTDRILPHPEYLLEQKTADEPLLRAKHASPSRAKAISSTRL